MSRLIDLGLNKLSSIISEMSGIAEKTVLKSIDAYREDRLENTREIFSSATKLRFLQDEVSELTTELIARFQPVATDLRYIKSCMEIAYGFSRLGRYAYDIINVFEIFGSLNLCDKSPVIFMSKIVLEMMEIGITSLRSLDASLTNAIYEKENTIDILYRKSLRDFAKNVGTHTSNSDNRCIISSTLILKYLERISDHACYIADCVNYIKTGESSPRR